MKCPGCGNEDAYMGFSSIDCPSSSCHYYQGSSEPASWPSPASLPSRPTATAPAPTQGSTGSATAVTSALRVQIVSHTPRRSWVEIIFVAHGDPGPANKTVEFLWSLPGNPSQQVTCTLSSRNTFYVAGVEADGQRQYTTQWRCNLDGVQPGDIFTLTARIQ